jgi:pyridoxamine 5'-phosphate oxidase
VPASEQSRRPTQALPSEGPSGNPIARFKRWFAQARKAQDPMLDVAALATADARRQPTVRFVLLKWADERGFVFYTDKRSAKGRMLAENPSAALAFYWDRIDRQARVEGSVEEVSAEEADAYWASRERGSQLSASVSTQSAPLKSRADLIARLARTRRTFAGATIARPNYWTGFRLRPQRMEFWIRGANRLHRRELFVRTGKGWKRLLLQP